MRSQYISYLSLLDFHPTDREWIRVIPLHSSVHIVVACDALMTPAVLPIPQSISLDRFLLCSQSPRRHRVMKFVNPRLWLNPTKKPRNKLYHRLIRPSHQLSFFGVSAACLFSQLASTLLTMNEANPVRWCGEWGGYQWGLLHVYSSSHVPLVYERNKGSSEMDVMLMWRTDEQSVVRGGCVGTIVVVIDEWQTLACSYIAFHSSHLWRLMSIWKRIWETKCFPLERHSRYKVGVDTRSVMVQL